MRVNITLLVCLLTSAFMALEASASVDFVNQWPATPTIVSNGASATATGKFTAGMGTNRLMLVAVATEYSAAQAPTFTVSYGGQTVTQIVTNTAQNNKIWLGYLNNAGIIAAGANTTLSVTTSVTTNLTAMYANVAVFNGVDQTTPLTGNNSNATAASATLALTIPLTANAGLAGNTGMSIYLANWNGQTSTPAGGYTELRDYTGTNFNFAACYKVITGTTNETPTTTAAAATIGAAAGVSINPAVRLYQILAGACGDCHGNPPVTGTRNSPAGAVAGSHEKHAAGTNVDYAYACTACHRSNALVNHANGRKNIAGARLPNTAYSNTSSIAISNSPTMGTCSNVSCHSTGRAVPQYTVPTWGGAANNCLSCHAGRAGTGNGVQANSSLGFKLSSSHSQHLKYTATEVNCNMCHGTVASFDGTNLTLKNYSGVIYHANGTNNVVFRDLAYGTYTAFKTATKTCNNISCHGGKSRGGWQNASINTTHTCTHCHGQPTAANILPSNTNRKNFAPGWLGTGTSTDQISTAGDLRVGAHFVHLSSVYTKQIKCNECHRVPATSFDGTHMTGPRYSSQSITFLQASTAIKNTTATAFVSGTAIAPATCTTTYCHGSKLILNDTAGTNRSPQWNQNLTTGTPGTVECARCHGNPPNSSTGNHGGATPTTSCYGCHPNVVNASGAVINKTLHINGVNDFNMACANCHDYDTRSSGTVWGNTNYGGTALLEGRGAHAKHIEYLKTKAGVTLNAATDTYGGAAFNATCGVCHSVLPADHTPGSTAGTRTINFGSSIARQFGVSAPVFNGAYNTSSSVNPKSCSNTDCHYRTSPIWSTY